MQSKDPNWIGVDLDGTLALHDRYGADYNDLYIGDPILPMVERVKKWIEDGKTVKIFTARANPKNYSDGMQPGDAVMRHCEIMGAIKAWCIKQIGYELEITCQKDRWMTELWDDRCVQIEKNVGEPVTYWTSRAQ